MRGRAGDWDGIGGDSGDSAPPPNQLQLRTGRMILPGENNGVFVQIKSQKNSNNLHVILLGSLMHVQVHFFLPGRSD